MELWDNLFAQETFVILKAMLMFIIIALAGWGIIYKIDDKHSIPIRFFMGMNISMMVSVLIYIATSMMRVADIIDRYYTETMIFSVLSVFFLLISLNLARCGTLQIYNKAIPWYMIWLAPVIVLFWQGMLQYKGIQSVIAMSLPSTLAISIVCLKAIWETVQLSKGTSKADKLLQTSPFILIVAGTLYRAVYVLVDVIAQGNFWGAAQNIDDTQKYYLWTLFVSVAYLNILMMIHLLQDQIASIRFLSKRDTLTSAYNRAELTSIIQKQLHNVSSNREKFSVIIFDLDFFKKVNDTLGHIGGDAALIHSVKIAKDSVRKLDTVGRYGGEEFVIVCPQTALDGAMFCAEKIRVALETTKFVHDGAEYELTASFGVTECKYNDTFNTLINRADNALYEAKNTGRNKVVKAQ